ncbi:TPA: ATP-binding cassette domain-containing protein [Bacillus pseudomycoides]|nr:ATP-binding cassette domain-containing protein [Bacillus pseudomycoides]
MKHIVQLKNIQKKYKDHVIFDDLNLSIKENSFFGIVGASGSGKTTLLNIIGLIDTFDRGEMIIDGQVFHKNYSKESLLLRRNKIGYLFQNFGLADDETVEWNLNLALAYKKQSKKEKQQCIADILKQFHLEHLKGKKIYQLSGGEQQRIAILRLILQNPDIIITDEPTSSLDEKNETVIMEHLQNLHYQGKTIIIVTHNEKLKRYFTDCFDLTSIDS